MKRSDSLMADTHARHVLSDSGPDYSLDSALHLSRYTWASEQHGSGVSVAVDLGCGTGFGVSALRRAGISRVVGIDLQPTGKINDIGTELITANLCEPQLAQELGLDGIAQLIVSMETIEHLEDYFTFVENAAAMLADGGVVVIGTPNRTMTYNRYPGRRHMDPSHVQEFTPVALVHVLGEFFAEVELWYQLLPSALPLRPVDLPAAPSGFRSRVIRYAKNVGAALASPIRSRMPRDLGPAPTYRLDQVTFTRGDVDSTEALTAFCLLAVCRLPGSRARETGSQLSARQCAE